MTNETLKLVATFLMTTVLFLIKKIHDLDLDISEYTHENARLEKELSTEKTKYDNKITELLQNQKTEIHKIDAAGSYSSGMLGIFAGCFLIAVVGYYFCGFDPNTILKSLDSVSKETNENASAHFKGLSEIITKLGETILEAIKDVGISEKDHSVEYEKWFDTLSKQMTKFNIKSQDFFRGQKPPKFD